MTDSNDLWEDVNLFKNHDFFFILACFSRFRKLIANLIAEILEKDKRPLVLKLSINF